MRRPWFIYGLQRGRKILYVGKTRNIYRRMKEHRRELGRWPQFCILEIGYLAGWWIAERKWIARIKPPWNIAKGGFGRDTHVQSTKRKLSVVGKGIKKPGTSRAMKALWKTDRETMLERSRTPNSGQFKKGYTSPRRGGHREDLSEKARKTISKKVSKLLVGNQRATGKPWTEEQKARLRGRIPWNKGLLNWQGVVGARRRI